MSSEIIQGESSEIPATDETKTPADIMATITSETTDKIKPSAALSFSTNHDIDEESEEVDDEEALFVALEKEKEKEAAEEAAHPHPHPTDIKSAPKLLQDALKAGVIKVNESAADGKRKTSNGKDDGEGDFAVQGNNDSNEEKKNEAGDAEVAPSITQKVCPNDALTPVQFVLSHWSNGAMV